MTLIIDIPDEDYDKIKDNSPDAFNYLTSWRLYDAIKNGTQLFENPTNGDMIKAVFPNFEEDVTIVGDTILLERYMPYCKMQFHRDWWDAPYERR